MLSGLFLAALPIFPASAAPAPVPRWTEVACDPRQFGTTVLLGVLLFDSGDAAVNGNAKRAITSARDVGTGMGAKGIVLIGFSDGVGSDSTNGALSLERAREAGKAWSSPMPSAVPLTVSGCGSGFPLVKEIAAHPRSENRRVELRAIVN